MVAAAVGAGVPVELGAQGRCTVSAAIVGPASGVDDDIDVPDVPEPQGGIVHLARRVGLGIGENGVGRDVFDEFGDVDAVVYLDSCVQETGPEGGLAVWA